MKDIDAAKANLAGHSACLAKGDEIEFLDGSGVAPLLKLIASGKDCRGFSCADAVVGKAAAMLFAKMGIACVHGKVMSRHGREFLEIRGIPLSFDELVDSIKNRDGSGMCPMEMTVIGIDDPEKAYLALRDKAARLRGGH